MEKFIIRDSPKQRQALQEVLRETFQRNNGRFNGLAVLLGAGFTKNFGGYLARDFANHLLLTPQLRQDKILQKVVVRAKTFEEALANEDLLLSGEQILSLREAVHTTFRGMDADIKRSVQSRELSISRVQQLIARLRAGGDCAFLFTLNQDLWLERYLYNHQMIEGLLPRLHPVSCPFPTFDVETSRRTFDEMVVQTEDYQGHSRHLNTRGALNIVKLHGSSNWVDSHGIPLMVVGGNKGKFIARSGLFSDSLALFQNVLRLGGTKLLTIGYSFRDPHIDSIIAESHFRDDLKLYVWDQIGLQKLGKHLDSIHEGFSGCIAGYEDSSFEAVFSHRHSRPDPFTRTLEDFLLPRG